MLKFKFNYLTNTLAYQKETNSEIWYELGEERQFTGFNFNSRGFSFDDGQLIFTINQSKIRAFYKRKRNSDFIFFRKDLPHECPVIFTFAKEDQIKKINSRWVKKPP